MRAAWLVRESARYPVRVSPGNPTRRGSIPHEDDAGTLELGVRWAALDVGRVLTLPVQPECGSLLRL